MKKLFKLTTLSFIGPFVATFFLVLLVLLLQFLWVYIDDLVGKGLEWYILTELMFYASASFVPLALPLAILLSSIMSFGKLAETLELLALKSAGISLIRIMVPQITLVVLLSGGAFYFANNIIPRANLKFHALLWDVRQQRPALDIKEGVFYNGIDNYSIRIQKKNDDKGTIDSIKIYDHTRNRGNDIMLVAKSGEMYTTKNKRYMILKLYDGVRYEEMESRDVHRRSYPHNRLYFKSYEMSFDLSAFNLEKTKEELFKDHYKMLNVSQLQQYEDSMRRTMHSKRDEVLAYGRPYFQFFRDTAYHYNTRIADFDKLPATVPFVRNFTRDERSRMVSRALVSARSLKEVFRVQAEELDNYKKLINTYRLEWHRKFALSVACLTLFFIGSPLGAIIRKGGIGMPTVVSIILFIIFYIISIFGEKSAKEGLLDPIIGMWLPTMILLPFGFFLTWRANSDAISFNLAGFRNPFSRWFGRFKRKHENTAAV